MAAVVGGLHAVGFFLLIVLVAPHHYRMGTSGAFTIGVGVTAYTLGLRHGLTPTTSRPSTTPPASSCPRASGR
jgi:high-affinity nickel permease